MLHGRMQPQVVSPVGAHPTATWRSFGAKLPSMPWGPPMCWTSGHWRAGSGGGGRGGAAAVHVAQPRRCGARPAGASRARKRGPRRLGGRTRSGGDACRRRRRRVGLGWCRARLAQGGGGSHVGHRQQPPSHHPPGGGDDGDGDTAGHRTGRGGCACSCDGAGRGVGGGDACDHSCRCRWRRRPVAVATSCGGGTGPCTGASCGAMWRDAVCVEGLRFTGPPQGAQDGLRRVAGPGAGVGPCPAAAAPCAVFYGRWVEHRHAAWLRAAAAPLAAVSDAGEDRSPLALARRGGTGCGMEHRRARYTHERRSAAGCGRRRCEKRSRGCAGGG